MWKPQGASYDDKGQRVCDNQSCNKCLEKARYALVVDKQKWSDTRAIDRGKSKGLAAWMHCESCDSRMSSDKKSVVYPDGYMPGVREQDRSKATPEMRERMSGGGGGFKKGGGGSRHAKANAAAAAASDSDDDAESIAFGSEASTYSQSSQAEELRAARQEALEAKLAAAMRCAVASKVGARERSQLSRPYDARTGCGALHGARCVGGRRRVVF